MTKSTFTQIFHPAAVLALMTGTAPAALANDVSPQALPAPVPAQLVEDIGAAERIDVADRLRTLTQLIPASACHLHGGVLADEARQMLTVAHDTFTVLTDALLDGDESLNIIGAEQRPKTIAEIEAINVAWQPTDDAVMRLLADANDTEALAVIKDTNGPLFDKASHLLSELEGEYTNPTELLLVDMLLIEIAGRQSMLTQKMSKEVCTIWCGQGVAGHDRDVRFLDEGADQRRAQSGRQGSPHARDQSRTGGRDVRLGQPARRD